MVIHLHQRGEEPSHTIWEELGVEFPEIFNLCMTQTLENTGMDQEMKRPMTETEKERLKAVIPKETIIPVWSKEYGTKDQMDSLLKCLPQRRLTNLSYCNTSGCPV